MQSYGFYDYDFFPMEIGEQNKDAFVANYFDQILNTPVI